MRLIDADKIMADIESAERSTSKDYILLTIARYIRIQPTIDAEPVRHGHWDIFYTDNIPYTLKCSECGEYTLVNGKYCPNCGCKMDLDEVEE